MLTVAVLAAAPAAPASELIDRNATNVRLEVSAGGQALLSYRARGKQRHVLVWGATNAVHPAAGRRQVEFRLDYSGGWGTFRRNVWKSLKNVCRPYSGPALHWLVAACTAPDGSHWAVQSWQRALPNYGLSPGPSQAVWELRLSHWTGPLAELTIHLDWAYARFDHLFGTFSYRGKPVYGFRSKPSGEPLDRFGRNIYLDTFDSRYGAGWRRENSFLTHRGTGVFCYGFFGHGSRPPGKGTRYRATVIGPGVTPDVYWESPALGPYDRAHDLAMQELQRELYGPDARCKPV